MFNNPYNVGNFFFTLLFTFRRTFFMKVTNQISIMTHKIIIQKQNGMWYLCVMFSTRARDTELPPFFQKLSVYVFIFNIISLLFHLFFLNLTSSCSYSCYFMITATLKCVNPRKKKGVCGNSVLRAPVVFSF